MNEHDYKEIAKIINYQINILNEHVAQDYRKVAKEHLINVTNRLADYFEKANIRKQANYNRIEGFHNEIIIGCFNRKQFLKDCGVKNGR